MEQVAVVTGVASGIGKYVAQMLYKRKVRVFGIDVEKVSLDNIDCYVCDVSDENQVINFIEKLKLSCNKVDYLINVAGILCYKQRNVVEKLDTKEWKKVFSINLDSVFYMTKHLIPLLKRSNAGSIINFSSEQVRKVKKKSAPYAVTKVAVEMLTKILALELLDEHIRVNAISLASVNTNFIKNYIADDERMNELIKKADSTMPYGIINVEDVWHMVEYLIQDDNKITGQILLIDSGVTLQ